MAQYVYDQCLISYKVNINDKCFVCGCWLIGVRVKMTHGLGTTLWVWPWCSIRTPIITVRFLQCEKVVTGMEWFRLDVGWGGGLREGRVSCLDPGFWHFQWLTVANTPRFSIPSVLSLSIWEGHGVFMLHSAPGVSMLYLAFDIVSFSLVAPVQTCDWYQTLVGEEAHLYRSNLMPIRPSQNEGVGHSPQCTPCYNSLNQVTTFSRKIGRKL